VIKTIIFDFGNVVGFFDHWQALGKLTPYTDVSPPEMFARVYQGTVEDEVERGLITPQAFLEHVHRLWELRCEIDFVTRAFVDIFTPNPEVCALIPLLRPGYRVVLGSNTNELHARQFRRQFADVFRHFDHLVLSHEIGQRKPHPAFYAHCQTVAHAEPHECVFIDDLAENIAAARAHGWHGIVYRPDDDLAGKLRALGVAV
jgi:putative hydrolase of the HAD superfamily